MIVVDASALTNFVTYTDALGDKTREAMIRDPQWIAPEHLHAETFSAVRGLTLGRKISEAQGEAAVGLLAQAPIRTIRVAGLLQRMWELRHGISAYDAAYVALAEVRDATLVTADARLANTASAYCRVELVS